MVGLVVGIGFILIFIIFSNISQSIITIIPTIEPRISQQRAIHIAKQDIESNYIRNSEIFKIDNITKHGNSYYIPIQEFMASTIYRYR